MSVQPKRPRTRPPVFNQPARSTDSPPAASSCTSAQTALDDCITATSLIEVTLHSLDSQVIAIPEQEVLKKALQAMWPMYGWIDDCGAEQAGVRDMAELVKHAGTSNSLMAEKKARP